MAFDIHAWYRDPEADIAANKVIVPRVRRWMLCGSRHTHCLEDVVQRIKIRWLEQVGDAGSCVVQNEKEALTYLGLITWYFFHTVVNGRVQFKFHEVRTYCLSFRHHVPLAYADMAECRDLTPDDRVEAEQSCQRIIALLHSLGEDAEPLIYHVFCRMSYGQIAELFDSPVGTIRSRISRTREKLQALLKPPDIQ